jgi:hypothetical protein
MRMIAFASSLACNAGAVSIAQAYGLPFGPYIALFVLAQVGYALMYRAIGAGR